MELHSGSETKPGGSAARKKRSDFQRRPHPDPKSIGNWQNGFTLPSLLADYGGQTFQSPNSAIDTKSDENHHDALNTPLSDSAHLGNEKKPKKVKLKLGGVTHTIHANSSSGAAQQKQKSTRNLKKRAINDGFDDEDDEEIRYLKKLRASRVSSSYGDRLEESSQKTKGIAKIMGLSEGSSGSDKGGRKTRIYEDNDYEKELASDDELKDKKQRFVEDIADLGSGYEMTMTTRKRALESLDSGGHVEFPNGLPDAPSKKQKLSEVEQQLRKAEAAQRRRLQAEKAAKEAQAEAIRKILGQDSNRKKKEEKLKRQQEELAQERSRKARILGPSTVRYVMGPQGTVVTFSEDLGLPKIFNSPPCRYPPPREKCAGPNCTNEYKYRDSKSKLPLCSLHCYKALQGNTDLLPAC